MEKTYKNCPLCDSKAEESLGSIRPLGADALSCSRRRCPFHKTWVRIDLWESEKARKKATFRHKNGSSLIWGN